MTLNTPTEKIYNTSSKSVFPNEVLGTKFETVSFEKEVSDAKAHLRNPEIRMIPSEGTPVQKIDAPDAPPQEAPITTETTTEPDNTEAPQKEDYMADVRSNLDVAPVVAQSQIDEEEAQVADLMEPPVVDQEAMRDSFNTEFTEEELNQEKVDNLQNIGETPEDGVIRNTDLLDAVEVGDKAAAFKAEMENYTQGKEGALTKTFRNIDYALAPFMSPVALVGGMMAHQPNTGTVIGDLLESASKGGEAANERLFRWFAGEEGGMMPDHFGTVVDNLLPNLPAAWQPTAAIALELMITMPMSLGMASAMRASLQTVQTLGRVPQHGMFTEAMYQLLDWAPESKAVSASTKKILDQFEGAGTDSEKIRDIIRDAELVDQGDKAAYIRLNEKVSGIRGYGSETTEQVMETVNGLLGDANSPTLTKNQLAKNQYDEAGLLQDVSALADSNARKYNLAAMDDFGDFNRSIDQAFNEAKTKAELEFNPKPDVPVVPKVIEPKPKFPKSIHVGLGSIPITPLEFPKGVAYSELGPDKLRDLLMRGPNRGSDTMLWVSDNPDLAIGQGHNKGIKVEFKSDYLSGEEALQPGKMPLEGSEYKTNFIAGDAIDKITIAKGTKIHRSTGVNLKSFDKTIDADGNSVFTAKEKKVEYEASEFVSKTHEQIILETKAANKNIEELYAMDLNDMTAVDATALMEITVDSSKQLANYTQIFYDPNVSKATKDVAKAAFAKQLIAHKMIQAKVTGWGSQQGQNLNIMKAEYLQKLIDSMSTRVC